VGLASSICKKFNCTPRKVYTEHLDELKALMTKGVVSPDAFDGGIGDSESYHFKDIGWFHLKDGTCADNSHMPRQASKEEIEKFRYCVKHLELEHKYPTPDKWK
jgi:hypothetical protein